MKMDQWGNSKFCLWVETYGRARLAREIGVSWTTVYLWALGINRPSIERAGIIAKLCGIEPAEIRGGKK